MTTIKQQAAKLQAVLAPHSLVKNKPAVQAAWLEYGNLLASCPEKGPTKIGAWVKDNGLDFITQPKVRSEAKQLAALVAANSLDLNECPNCAPHDILIWLRANRPELFPPRQERAERQRRARPQPNENAGFGAFDDEPQAQAQGQGQGQGQAELERRKAELDRREAELNRREAELNRRSRFQAAGNFDSTDLLKKLRILSQIVHPDKANAGADVLAERFTRGAQIINDLRASIH